MTIHNLLTKGSSTREYDLTNLPAYYFQVRGILRQSELP